MTNNIRIVKVSTPEELKNYCNRNVYYKIQKRFLGFLWWDDLTEPEYGMIYPTFNTLKEAETWIMRTYFLKETVIREYHTENFE